MNDVKNAIKILTIKRFVRDKDLIPTLQDLLQTGFTPEDLVSFIQKQSFPLPPEKVPDISAMVDAVRQAEECVLESKENEILSIPYTSKGYPDELRLIKDPPACLFIRGNHKLVQNPEKCAVVGTRKPTDSGLKKGWTISHALGTAGITVVAGLAAGIDTESHKAALETAGSTIAILGHGLDMVYPAANKGLYFSILENNGTIMSEYPLRTPLSRWRLVARDRIQSGISKGVCVIQTDIKGGTMHTVESCLSQKRLLCVVRPPDDESGMSYYQGNTFLFQKYDTRHNFLAIDSEDSITGLIQKIRSFSLFRSSQMNVSGDIPDSGFTLFSYHGGMNVVDREPSSDMMQPPSPVVHEKDTHAIINGKPKRNKKQRPHKGNNEKKLDSF